jgi:hypothetical protein
MPQNGNSVTLRLGSEVVAVLASEAVVFVPAASDVAASPPITAAKAVSSASAIAVVFLSIFFHLLFVLKDHCPNAY